jgi:hypothetical protein
MADDDVGPGVRRLTVFGVLEPGWAASAPPSDATLALGLLYPEVPLSAADVKRLEKAKKFREKQLKEKEAKEKDGGGSVSHRTAALCTLFMGKVVAVSGGGAGAAPHSLSSALVRAPHAALYHTLLHSISTLARCTFYSLDAACPFTHMYSCMPSPPHHRARRVKRRW